MAGRNHNSHLFLESVPGSLKYLGWVLLLVALMIGDARNGWLTRSREILAFMLEPLYYLVDSPYRLAERLDLWLEKHEQLLEENEALSRENARLKLDLLPLSHMQEENRQLRELLNAPPHRDFNTRMARILNAGLDSYNQNLLIDLGSEDGVESGQILATENGIAGQVRSTQAHSSWVMLITDPDHALPVTFSNSGFRTIAYGSGSSKELVLPHVPISQSVSEGELLVTSGMGGLFPAGYPVARVSALSSEKGERFKRITATVLARLDELEFLLLMQATKEVKP